MRCHVYGELIGGSYPHRDARRRPQKEVDHISGCNSDKAEASDDSDQIELVQSEIFYCSDLEWYCFDVAIQTQSNPAKVYLDYPVGLSVSIRNSERMLVYRTRFAQLAAQVDFDIQIHTNSKAHYTCPQDAIKLFVDCELICARPLFIGSLQDATTFSTCSG